MPSKKAKARASGKKVSRSAPKRTAEKKKTRAGYYFGKLKTQSFSKTLVYATCTGSCSGCSACGCGS